MANNKKPPSGGNAGSPPDGGGGSPPDGGGGSPPAGNQTTATDQDKLHSVDDLWRMTDNSVRYKRAIAISSSANRPPLPSLIQPNVFHKIAAQIHGWEAERRVTGKPMMLTVAQYNHAIAAAKAGPVNREFFADKDGKLVRRKVDEKTGKATDKGGTGKLVSVARVHKPAVSKHCPDDFEREEMTVGQPKH